MIFDILGKEFKEGQTVVGAVSINNTPKLEFRKVHLIKDGKLYMTNKTTSPTLKPEKWLIVADPE